MTTPSHTFLFATWEGGGNIPPVVEAIRRLAAAGHRVRVLGEEVSRPAIEAAGAEFIGWATAPNRRDWRPESAIIRDWEATTPTGGIEQVRDIYMVDNAAAYAADVLAELDAVPADAVVSSEMLLGTMMAAEARGVPLAILSANIALTPVPGLPPLGPGLPPPTTDEERAMHAAIAAGVQAMFDARLADFNAIRARFGLKPLAHLLDQVEAADRTLLGTSACFDYPTAMLPHGMRYVGPLLAQPNWAEAWQSPWHANDARPLVLVSFSTTFQNQTAQIARTVAALGTLPVRALVTLGPSIEADAIGALPGNVTAVASAPHDAVMREADIVVTHGGHGTTLRALRHGCAVLCLPMGRDQNDNAERVAWHGAGLRASAEADAATIAAAIGRLLNEPQFASRAAALGRQVMADIEASPLVHELAGVAALKPSTAEPRERKRTG